MLRITWHRWGVAVAQSGSLKTEPIAESGPLQAEPLGERRGPWIQKSSQPFNSYPRGARRRARDCIWAAAGAANTTAQTAAVDRDAKTKHFIEYLL